MKHLCKIELGKACFVYGAAYSDTKNLAKGSIADKILKDRVCEIPRNRKYGEYISKYGL